jgi:two-component system, cell cycle response regulator
MTLRAVVADDEPVTSRRLQRLLQGWEFDVEVVDNGVDALMLMTAPAPPELAILDWEMPGLDGIDVLKGVRSSGRSDGTYLLMLTGRDRPQDRLAALEAGADDFISKPFDPGELQARVQSARRLARLSREVERLRESLRTALHVAVADEVGTRASADELVAEVAFAAVRSGDAVFVAELLLDGMLQIRRAHGAEGMDEVVDEAARRLKAAMGTGRSVVRIGSDRFRVVSTIGDRAAGEVLAERLRQAVGEQRVTLSDRASCRVTVSVGWSVATAAELYRGRDLVAAASDALRSLRAGRGNAHAEQAFTLR